jgi:hypothetical protein
MVFHMSASSNFNLRGISSDLMILLKREAKRLNISVNILILQMIERGLGITRKKIMYHDLDHLAGSWSSAEAKKFEEDTQYFEQIDKDLWS